ncbi:CG445 protein, partial [Acromyrmex charruanus]
MDPNVLIIDVRTPKELKDIGAIPGTINIQSDDVVQEFDLPGDVFLHKYKKPKPTKDTKIIFFCRSGNRSKCVQKKIMRLRYQEYDNIFQNH